MDGGKECSLLLAITCLLAGEKCRRFNKECIMRNWKTSVATMCALLVLNGCANMTAQQKNTAIGAAVGGVLGSVLSNHSGIGTVGGAAVGGVIGNQIKH